MKCNDCENEVKAIDGIGYKGLIFCSDYCLEQYKSMEWLKVEALIPVRAKMTKKVLL